MVLVKHSTMKKYSDTENGAILQQILNQITLEFLE